MEQHNIQLPRPTGAYHVGMSTYVLKDISRYYKQEKGRPLLVHLYYPCVQTHKEYPLYLSNAMHLYKEKLARTYAPDRLAYLDEIRDRAMPDVPIDTESAPFPVLFFAHGFFMAAQLYSSLIEELASHGYIVVAINHTDACWPVVFPDGESLEISSELADIFSNKERSCLQTFDMTQEVWVEDIEYVRAWLQNLPFARLLDLSRIGIFGHSFGGSTAIEAARQNNDFKAAANLDGLLFGSNWDKPLAVPSLFIVAEKVTTHEDAQRAGLTKEQFDSLLSRDQKKVFDQIKR